MKTQVKKLPAALPMICILATAAITGNASAQDALIDDLVFYEIDGGQALDGGISPSPIIE